MDRTGRGGRIIARTRTIRNGPGKARTRKAAPAIREPAASGPRLYTLEVFLIGGPVTRKFARRNPVVSRTILIRGDQTLKGLHHASTKR